MSALESLVLGALAVLLLFWMQPGIKAAMQKSRQAPTDWRGLILPMGFVIMFVLFLIAMV